MTTTSQQRPHNRLHTNCGNRTLSNIKGLKFSHQKLRFIAGTSPSASGGSSTPGSSPSGSINDSRSSCVGRNSCSIS